ncbi:MAG TPA: pantoate--beta-alanine ligase [Acetobacteraceae bacterium]|nr:pantoate--beta-alanine ligase [Acetobacteraceae bacterium]
MLICRTRAELAEAVSALRARRGALALVPTMGALHDGHMSLLGCARQAAPVVAASIFVNPTQFGPNEDFARYPREEARDLGKLEAAGCDLVWLPTVAEMYPAGDATMVEMSGPAIGWEGALRPGHFRGVATVVAKLFGQVRPDAAIFGEKDWQQLQVITRMARDLSLSVRVIGAPVVREPDGLAMSSRNRFLSDTERAAAPILYEALCGVRDAMARGSSAGNALLAGRTRLADHAFGLDYLALVDNETLVETDRPGAGARLIAAAKLGSVRLLDNIASA